MNEFHRLNWVTRAGICLGYSALIYFFISEAYVFAHDPANFCLAARHGWSIYEERPHSPGYPWFVECFRLVSILFSVDEHHAMLIFNATLAGVALYLFWIFSNRQFAKQSFIPLLLFATNPVVVYFAASSEIYIYDAAFSTGLLLLVFYAGRKWFMPIMLFLGVLGGFRFTSLGLLLPAFIIVWHWRRQQQLSAMVLQTILGGVALILGILTWFLPYFYLPYGDFSVVVKARENLGTVDAAMYQQMIGFGTFLLWVFNFSILALFLKINKAPRPNSYKVQFLLLIAFPVLVFSFIHYAKGYVLLILPVLLILVSERIMRTKQPTRIALVLAGLNVALFFFVPFVETPVESSLTHEQRSLEERLKTTFLRIVSVSAPSYHHIQATDRAMGDALRLVRKHCPPRSAVFFDYSAPYCHYPRALQVYLPQHDLIAARRDASVVLFSGADLDYDILLPEVLRRPNLYYVIDRRLPNLLGVPPESELLEVGTYLAVYKTQITDTAAMMHYILREK